MCNNDSSEQMREDGLNERKAHSDIDKICDNNTVSDDAGALPVANEIDNVLDDKVDDNTRRTHAEMCCLFDNTYSKDVYQKSASLYQVIVDAINKLTDDMGVPVSLVHDVIENEWINARRGLPCCCPGDLDSIRTFIIDGDLNKIADEMFSIEKLVTHVQPDR